MALLEGWTDNEWAAEGDLRWWLDEARCRGAHSDVFFPPTGGTYAAAERICASCPVVEPCRAANDRAEAGLRVADIQGYFARETPRQRLARRAASAG